MYTRIRVITICFAIAFFSIFCYKPKQVFALSIDKAIKSEIKGMTKYKPSKKIYVPGDGIVRYDKAVNKYIKKWTKGWKKYSEMILKGDVYELLARTLYFESSPNNNPKKDRENEMLAFNRVINNRMNHKKTKYLYDGPGLQGVLTKEWQFAGLTFNKKSHKKIKYNKKRINLSLVRAVVVAIAEKGGVTKFKYPDKKKYCYFHSSDDWEKFTNKNHTKVRFTDSVKYYKVTMKIKYSDTVFYDYKK